MLSLGTRSRGALVAGALLAFAGAYATTPIVARSAAEPLVPSPSLPPSSALTTPIALVAPQRDPFARAPAPIASSFPAIPAALGALPPNPGAPVSIPPPALRVTAIVSGSHPYALVDENGIARIVSAGDALAGERIAAIDAEGIHLAHGTTLPIAAPSPAAAPGTLIRSSSLPGVPL
ncbi:MAG TPA: hypothetical protein VE591_08720 [Candidatus Acidoferrum sp.]|jgi:hypothetical protein|nr:hypothetical protein [Candidatus Acidoferrum sp.]